MDTEENIFIGQGEGPVHLNLKLANRHGLIAGATGTGKTVTLQVLAEGFSRQGVPVFMADVKGDLSGISQAGTPSAKLQQRANDVGLSDYTFTNFPTIFWDLFGEQGHPVRSTVSDMGPLLLSRLLDLNDTQEGILDIAFHLADEEGLLLLDFKDLRAIINHVGENATELTTQYGNVSKASVGAIQRRLLSLEQQGGVHFFGEPALQLQDLMRVNAAGQGYINILAANQLMLNPKLYATCLLWLMAELFEELPEVGDPDKPRLVLFFDEAHLMFDDAPKALIDKVEQVVRLIRSKGVGIYFISQNPNDIPDAILGQLGNRFQHALRAFTPRDQKAVTSAANTFRANPKLDTATIITELGVGEALVSTLQDKGTPSMVMRVTIRPPCSRLGPANTEEVHRTIGESPLQGRYERAIDRESAHELLNERAKQMDAQATQSSRDTTKPKNAHNRRQRQGVLETMLKSVVRSVGSGIGRQLVRGILGSLLKR